MRTVRHPAGMVGEVALGWHIRSRDAQEIVWHNGGTGGYRSFLGFDPAVSIGVVVLTNLSTPAGVDDIGFHLLDPEVPLLPAESPLLLPPRSRTAIAADADLLEQYSGRYKFAPEVFMTITREGNRLFAQLTGQGPAEIFPESEREFFYRVVDAQITFRTDGQGRVNALVLHQLNQDQIARRLDSDAEPLEEWFGNCEAVVDPALFDSYAGQYRLGPGATITVTREGNQLFLQLIGQPRLEVFPESERGFFYKVVDAQITFETDSQGPATDLVLHQGGQDLRATRME